MSAAWLSSAFAHPEWALPVLGVVCGAALLLAAAAARGRRRLRALLGPLAPRPVRGADAALLVALAAVGVALLGPRIGERIERVPAAGVDLVVLIDVSQSMETRDVPPSRLDRARRAAEEVLARLAGGDRAALAAFAGRGVLLSPLTPDLDALVEMLPAVDTDLMQPRGSRLAEGVRAALGAYGTGADPDRPRILLVLGDGEAPVQGGEDDDALAEAARAGVRVLAASFGTATGAAVPDGGVPLRDAAGRVVISRPDPRRLASLVAPTGGEAFATDAWGVLDADAVARAVRRDAPLAPGETRERRVPAVRVAPFAALAFLALALELARPWRRRRAASPAAAAPGRADRGAGANAGGKTGAQAARGAARRAGTAALVALALAWPARAATPERDEAPAVAPPVPEAEAALRTRPGDPALLVQLGIARMAAGDPGGAARAFGAAALGAKDPAVTALAYYDLGVASLAEGRLEDARDAFFDALAFAPRDLRARFNLEWTLRALAAQPPPDDSGGASDEEGKEQDGERGRDERSEAPDGDAAPDDESAAARSPRPDGGARPEEEGERGRREGGAAADRGADGAQDAESGAEGNDGERPAQPQPGRGSPPPESAEPGDASASAAAGGGAPTPQLSPKEAARWLEGVSDDPGRAARQLARRATAGGRPAPPGSPTW